MFDFASVWVDVTFAKKFFLLKGPSFIFNNIDLFQFVSDLFLFDVIDDLVDILYFLLDAFVRVLAHYEDFFVLLFIFRLFFDFDFFTSLALESQFVDLIWIDFLLLLLLQQGGTLDNWFLAGLDGVL